MNGPRLVGRGQVVRYAGLASTYLALYLLAAEWATRFSFPGSVLVWFPPAGVALGLLYLRPRLFPVAIVAELLSTTFVAGYASEFGPVGLVVNSVVIAGSYFVGALVMRRLRLDPRLRSTRDLLVVAAGCLVVGPTLAAVSGVLVQVWVGLVAWHEVLSSMGVFWVGDAVAAACVVPSLLIAGSAVLARRPLPISDREARESRLLIMAEYLVPSAVAVVVFVASDVPMQFVYLVFVPVVVVVVRHGITGAALTTAALSAVMTASAHAEVAGTLDRSDLQLFMLVVTATGLAIGAIVSARRDLLDRHRRLSRIIEATPDLVASTNGAGEVRYINTLGRKLLGLPEGSLEGRHAYDFYPDELSRRLLDEAMTTAERTGAWVGETTLTRVDGQTVPVSQVLVVHHDRGNDEVLYSTICRDMSDQVRLEEQLRRAALFDDATGLANRALLVEQLGHLVNRPGRAAPVAVLFADIDRYRRVNESFGYGIGDALVQAIAERVRTAVRAEDLVARYSGGQFAVVMPDVADEYDAIVVADRLVQSFAEAVRIGDVDVNVSGSIGVALADAGQVDHLDVLRSSEIAMHRAKEAGGDRFALFDEEMEHRSRLRSQMEADLREVLASEAWWLAYQPIVEVESRRIVSCEALLRWTHPVRGPISPFELIRLAENIGLIVPLGREIFHRACAEARHWHDHGFDLPVSINVSARQLQEPSFVDDVRWALDDTGVDASHVVVEVTETVLAEDLESEVRVLEALRSTGCRIAIDDFGTGYSSLSGLRNLPIDIVKLDQSFIIGLSESPRAAAMVEAVIRLADALELGVVAEGVEQEDQIDALRRMHCDRMQGFAISYPLDAAAFASLLEHPSMGVFDLGRRDRSNGRGDGEPAADGLVVSRQPQER
jgi:diguanylate cyclase (GGDEF)-like protein/PAS domain S-box-containing protein